MKKLKAGISLLCAVAIMLTSVCACGNKEKSIEDWDEDDFEAAAQEVEEAYDGKKSSKGSGSKGDGTKDSGSKEKSDSEEEDNGITYEMSDEIRNSKLSDGLIQIGDDIFKQCGYMSVGDVYDKYSDKYDFTIHYSTCVVTTVKDYDIPYDPEFYSENVSDSNQYLIMTSKADPDVSVVCSYTRFDFSNHEERIADKMIYCFSPSSLKAKENCWLSGWIGYTNNELTKDELVEFVERNGLVKGATEGSFYEVDFASGKFNCTIVMEETNAYGANPEYELVLSYNPETAKMDPTHNISFAFFSVAD